MTSSTSRAVAALAIGTGIGARVSAGKPRRGPRASGKPRGERWMETPKQRRRRREGGGRGVLVWGFGGPVEKLPRKGKRRTRRSGVAFA